MTRRSIGSRWLLTTLLLGAALLSGCGGDDACKGAGCLDVPMPGGDVADLAGVDTPAGDAATDVAPADTAADIETVTGSVCTTGDTNGCKDGRYVYACAPDGNSWVEKACFNERGEGVCLSGACTMCTPGQRRCEGDETVVECDQLGQSYEEIEDCQGELTGQVCDSGICTRLCELDIKFKDYMGCEYWAVDLDNAFVMCGGRSGYCDAQGAPFAVVVSNPHPEWPAEVKFWQYDEDAGAPVRVLEDKDGIPFDESAIPPGGLRVYYLPSRDINGTMQAPLAYRVESTIPITAYQFNPLENVEVFSNDASVLLPTPALGRYYYVMTREQTFDQLRSYVTVVAVNPGTTNVSVEVTAHTLVGDAAGIDPLVPGDTIRRTMRQYDVLNIETDKIGDDMTGTIVLADRPIAVFGGSEAANAPNTNHCIDNEDYDPGEPDSPAKVCEEDGVTPCQGAEDCSLFITCCADHLEMQLFPVKTWGKRYLATKSMPRGNEADSWRIIAAEDGTRITTMPPQLSLPVLNQGEWVDFESTQDFEIVANKPIMVGQFLQAEQAPRPGYQPGDAGVGDPAFLLAVPLEQLRTDYVFLCPDKYVDDYINIMAPVDATVDLDGARVGDGQFTTFGTGEFKVARLLVDDGVHAVTASAPVAVIVYGFDSYVSYGYPAGLNLSELNEEPGVQ